MRIGASSAARRARGPALAVVLGGTFLGGLDTYIVNLALPRIAADLGVGLAAVGWVLLAYLLAIGGLVVVAGRLADLRGTRLVFATGAATFTLGAALAGAAPELGWLIAARAVQGVGAAMLLAAGQAIVADLFGLGERGRALAALHVAVSLGFFAGPTLGGVLIEAFAWRSVFWVHLPIGALVAIAALRYLPAGRREPMASLDLPGAALLSGGLVAFLLGIGQVPDAGWVAPRTLGALSLAAVLLAAFARRERGTAQPIVDLRLFAYRGYTVGLAAAFVTFVAMASNMFLVPFLLQDLMALSPASAGLVMVAVPLAILPVAPLGGWLADRLGPRLPASAGLVLVSVAIGGLALVRPETAPWTVVAILILYGTGAGMFQAPNNSRVLGAVAADQRGIASGTLVTARQLGQLVGVAVASTVWVARQQAYEGSLAGDPALALAFRDTFVVLALVAAVGALISWLHGKEGGGRGHEVARPDRWPAKALHGPSGVTERENGSDDEHDEADHDNEGEHDFESRARISERLDDDRHVGQEEENAGNGGDEPEPRRAGRSVQPTAAAIAASISTPNATSGMTNADGSPASLMSMTGSTPSTLRRQSTCVTPRSHCCAHGVELPTRNRILRRPPGATVL